MLFSFFCRDRQLLSAWLSVICILGGMPAPSVVAQVAKGGVVERPRLLEGDCILSQTVLLMEDAKVTLKTEKGDIVVPMAIKTREVQSEEIVSVDGDGQISETRIEVLASMTVRETTIKEGEQERVEREVEEGVLDGLRLKYKQKGGSWEGGLADGDTPAELKSLLSNYIPPTEDSLLPSHPVQPGDKWTVNGVALRRLMPEAIKLAGKADCEYIRIVQRRARPHALIQWSLELETISLDDDKNEIKSRLGFTGQSWIEISSGIETESKGKGTMIVDTTIKGDIVRMAGSATIESTQQRMRLVKE